jgi:hypothetical protein
LDALIHPFALAVESAVTLPPSDLDWLTPAQLADFGLDDALIHRLVRLADHVSLDGQPCWSGDQLADLLQGVGSRGLRSFVG